MKDNKPLLIGLVLCAVVAAVAWPRVQWFKFELEVRDAFSDQKGVGRFPSHQQMVDLGPKIQALAKPYGYEPMAVKLRLVQKSHGPVRKWYLGASLSYNGKSFDIERWVETAIMVDDVEWLLEQGVAVKGKGREPD